MHMALVANHSGLLRFFLCDIAGAGDDDDVLRTSYFIHFIAIISHDFDTTTVAFIRHLFCADIVCVFVT